MRARRLEAQVLARLLAAAAGGRGGAIVVHGEAGIGKTALLEHALDQAPDMRRLSADGAEFEMELPFAALYQLCAPVLDRRVQLPAPQRAALEAVFGLREEGASEPLLVELAVLGLLAEVSHAEPVVCRVDDAQCVDAASLQALAFAARRIESERVALVFALRDPEATPPLAGLPGVCRQRRRPADRSARRRRPAHRPSVAPTATMIPSAQNERNRTCAMRPPKPYKQGYRSPNLGRSATSSIRSRSPLKYDRRYVCR